jgi:hypothetical protein
MVDVTDVVYPTAIGCHVGGDRAVRNHRAEAGRDVNATAIGEPVPGDGGTRDDHVGGQAGALADVHAAAGRCRIAPRLLPEIVLPEIFLSLPDKKPVTPVVT